MRSSVTEKGQRLTSTETGVVKERKQTCDVCNVNTTLAVAALSFVLCILRT
jgi:hypothetical protein